jgi:hypothetical protein
LFLGVKFWPKDDSGDFAAVAVLWGKSDDGTIICRKAFDFGTRPVSEFGKNDFAEVQDDIMLPAVKEWSRPLPSPGYPNLRSELESLTSSRILLTKSPDWCLTLPAKDLLYRVSSDESNEKYPYVLDEPRAIDDCHVDLQFFAWSANDIMGL